MSWKKARRLCVLLFAMISAMLIFKYHPVQSAISLVYFTAEGENELVRVSWETATELNNAGFFVQRSNQRDGSYQRIHSDIIPAQGNDFTGASYEYIDSSLVNGTQYWYRLESVDFGQNSQFSEPVNVIVGGTPVPTLTQTRTVQGTRTTSPQQTSAPTVTLTILPTWTTFPTRTSSLDSGIRATPSVVTPYPAPAQSQAPPVLPLQSSQPSPGSLEGYPPPGTPPPVQNDFSSGVTTLAPFPTVTIMFPKPTEVPLPADLPETNLFDINKLFDLWPLGLLLAGWLILGGWFYYSHRQDG